MIVRKALVALSGRRGLPLGEPRRRDVRSIAKLSPSQRQRRDGEIDPRLEFFELEAALLEIGLHVRIPAFIAGMTRRVRCIRAKSYRIKYKATACSLLASSLENAVVKQAKSRTATRIVKRSRPTAQRKTSFCVPNFGARLDGKISSSRFGESSLKRRASSDAKSPAPDAGGCQRKIHADKPVRRHVGKRGLFLVRAFSGGDEIAATKLLAAHFWQRIIITRWRVAVEVFADLVVTPVPALERSPQFVFFARFEHGVTKTGAMNENTRPSNRLSSHWQSIIWANVAQW